MRVIIHNLVKTCLAASSLSVGQAFKLCPMVEADQSNDAIYIVTKQHRWITQTLRFAPGREFASYYEISGNLFVMPLRLDAIGATEEQL